MYLEIYECDTAKNFFSSWISMASSFKKGQSKTRSFNWYLYLINGRKGIRGGICHSIYRYAKANNKYMKNYDKNNESISSILGCK